MLERQAHVLLHQPHIEPGLVRAVEQQWAARAQHRRADRARTQHVDRELGIDAAALGEQDALAERDHLYGQADVDGELHHQRLAVSADVRDGLAELAQERLDALERGPIAADHDRKAALRGGAYAARDGRLEHYRAEPSHELGELAARVRADGAHVHIDAAWAQAGQDAVRPMGDRLERRGVGDHAEDHLGLLGDLARRIAPDQAALPKRVRFASSSVGAVHDVARGQEAASDPAAHRSEPDEPDRAHRFVPSSSAASSSESSSVAAPSSSSTWSGRRKPTIAPSTAGLRSVHAIATAPGVVS